MRWQQGVRRALNIVGVEVARFPESCPSWRTARLLREFGVATVLDVGANKGQYASSLRRFGYSGEIISFEPVAEVLPNLCSAAVDDPRWSVRPVGLSDATGSAKINIAGNGAASSSVLPMLGRHSQAAPAADYVGTQAIEFSTVDLEVKRLAPPPPVFLKIDVQGYERQVLGGAEELLRSPSLIGIQLEISFVPLYQDGIGWHEALSILHDLELTIVEMERGFQDPRTKHLLQADVVAIRRSLVAD